MITHNMGVVAGLCSRVIVMYAGQIVEQGPVEQIFENPQHPYTWSLLRSIPRVDALRHERLRSIEGMAPDLLRPAAAAASIRAVRSGSRSASRTSRRSTRWRPTSALRAG